MCLRLYGPAIHEETDGDKEATDRHDIKAMLGPKVASLDVSCDSFIAVADVDELADKRTNAETKVCQYVCIRTLLRHLPQK